MLALRPAKQTEIELCYEFIKEARAFQQLQGFTQWDENYPTLSLLQNDVKDGIGYVFTKNDKPIGYCAITTTPDEAYT